MLICRNLYVPGHCKLEEMLICRNLYVPGHCKLEEMLICRNLYVPGHCKLEEMLICRNLYVPGHCKLEEILICAFCNIPLSSAFTCRCSGPGGTFFVLHCSGFPDYFHNAINCVQWYKFGLLAI